MFARVIYYLGRVFCQERKNRYVQSCLQLGKKKNNAEDPAFLAEKSRMLQENFGIGVGRQATNADAKAKDFFSMSSIVEIEDTYTDNLCELIAHDFSSKMLVDHPRSDVDAAAVQYVLARRDAKTMLKSDVKKPDFAKAGIAIGYAGRSPTLNKRLDSTEVSPATVNEAGGSDSYLFKKPKDVPHRLGRRLIVNEVVNDCSETTLFDSLLHDSKQEVMAGNILPSARRGSGVIASTPVDDFAHPPKERFNDLFLNWSEPEEAPLLVPGLYAGAEKGPGRMSSFQNFPLHGRSTTLGANKQVKKMTSTMAKGLEAGVDRMKVADKDNDARTGQSQKNKPQSTSQFMFRKTFQK